MKIVLIGQAPSRCGGSPLVGKIGVRLAKLAGISFAEYVHRTERRNVLAHWPGKHGKGDAFPMSIAKQSVENIRRHLAGRKVLLLGRGVARAFGAKLDYLTWGRLGPFEAAVLPHPSGINRWWNDKRNVRRASRFLGRCL